MIGWLFPAFLGGLAALAVPVILHLIKRRPTVVVVPSLRFVPRGFRAYQRRLRLHEYLLLALRLLLLAALVAAFAHPFVRTRMAGTAWQADATVFLLDVSLSMQARGPDGAAVWPAVMQDLRARVQALPAGHAWRVVAYADGVCATLQATDQWQRVLHEWETRFPTYGGTDYNAAWRAARDLLADQPGNSHVVWYTDLQKNALAAMAAHHVPSTCHVEIVPCTPGAVNQRIAFVDAARITDLGATTRVACVVGGAVKAADLQVYVDDVRVPTRVEPCAPGMAGTHTLTLPALRSGAHVVRAMLRADDAYAVDNQDSMLVYAAPAWHVLLVSSTPVTDTLKAKTLYLGTAMQQLVPGSEWHVTRATIKPEQLATQNLRDTRVIVLVDVARVPDAAVRVLDDFVRAGGSLLVFCGEHTDIAWHNAALAQRGLLPAQLTYATARARAGNYTCIGIEQWNTNHPALRWCTGTAADDLRAVPFYRVMRTIMATNADVIATFDNDDAYLASARLGRGTVALLTCTADRAWTAFPRSRLYLPFVRELVRWLAQEPDMADAVRTERIAVRNASDEQTRPGITLRSIVPLAAIKNAPDARECAGEQGLSSAAQAKLGVRDDNFVVSTTARREGKNDCIESWLIAAVFLLAALEGLYANAVSYV